MRGLILLLLLGGLFLSGYWYECYVLDHCGKTKIEQPTTPGTSVRATNLGLNENGKLPLNGYEQFAFNANSNSPNLSANNKEFLDAVTKYMKENPDHKLKITGYYTKNEKNKDSYANMGVSRAAEIRKLLVARGIKSDRFSLEGVVAGNLNTPARFDAILPSKDGKKLATTAQTFEDRTYYFDYNSDKFVPTSQFRTYTKEVVEYLKQDKSKRVSVIGHTDSDGEDAGNIALGRKRARMIRKYLVDNGVSQGRISIDSRGEREPAATNDTDAGKAKNRRVNVRLK